MAESLRSEEIEKTSTFGGEISALSYSKDGTRRQQVLNTKESPVRTGSHDFSHDMSREIQMALGT